MMEGALVSASTGVMESVLCKLSFMLGNQYSRNKRVENDVLFLRNELSSMNAVMQKHAMSKERDLQVKAWMKEVRELAYDIEDAIDAFMAQVEEKLDQPTGIKGFVINSIRKLRELVSSSAIAEEIEELKNQVREISDRRKRYKLDESTSKDTKAEIDPRLPALYTDVSTLVGVDGPRNKIIKLLIEDDVDGRFGPPLTLVSIVGFGGLGKTTLANQVYQKIKGQFDCSCFVFVSQRPHIKKVLVDLLSGLGGAGNMWDNKKKLINQIREFLHDKRYLIVIDDIWSISEWEILKCILPENSIGSRIITTTRILDIAKSCCSSFNGHIYPIEPLSDDNSRMLFFRRIFHTPDSCPSHLEELSVAILRKCGGLPLAILHIASLLATKSDTKDEWELVLNSIGSALENNHTLQGMKQILLLSFYDLPPHLKTCLLYLSIYPEDYKITPRSLIRRWIAEGFIAEERGKRLEQIAQSYINDLTNRSMITPMDIGYDGHVYQVHDMVLSIIKSLSAEENFVTIIDGQQSSPLPTKIRRLSLHFNDSQDEVMKTITTNQHCIRSVIVIGFTKQVPNFSNSRTLRLLDLGCCEWLQDHHIECIGSMLQLRYLVLHSNFITVLPDSIGNLKHLQMLNVKFCSIEILPETVIQLRKLICLYVSSVKLPDRIGNMQLLEELSHILLSSSSIRLAEELGSLRNLRHLTITVEDPSEMEDRGTRYKEVLLSSIYQLGRDNLESLSFDYRGQEDFILDSSMGLALQRLRKFIVMKPLSRVQSG
ncbi:hypothetical protein SETIT_8G103500v2 [Setaria italica]|uniref:AAA+ ATPase domain-containing protein n=1 Tax=Setaria italica TaxID=4555 RepID=A0A368S6E1_SETIT|nr:hypothetical protein SETIT_8G103500v2 [Setaria italica]